MWADVVFGDWDVCFVDGGDCALGWGKGVDGGGAGWGAAGGLAGEWGADDVDWTGGDCLHGRGVSVSLMKPKAVKAGATFGIVSPASAAREELVAAGVEALEALGYKTKMFPHALDRGPLNYAGTTDERVADLHAAFADDEVDAVLCTRGGWGSAELLPLLDKELIRAHPKAFLGYSDQTSLHVWLRNEVEMVSFQAPMVASDFGKGEGRGKREEGRADQGEAMDLESWRSALEGASEWELGGDAGLRVLRAGVAEGELSGGCVSIYVESLGTPYAARARGGVLFLEDVGVKPYQWDRMLVHLRLAGMLENVTGVVFGDMTQCCEADELPALEASLLHALRDFKGPIGIGLRSGHVERGNITLPFGVKVWLEFEDADGPRMRFLEAAVRA
jgi:muramoyltetrapeptide carboxypeptidase